jgi:antitoxin component YwqK of YwqJK toxin-antitoxin module
MKIQHFILILFILSGCNNILETEKVIILDKFENGNTKHAYVYPNKNVTSRFRYITYYEDGTIAFEGDVENGYYKGTKKSYFENGNPKEFCHLKDSGEFGYCCPDGYYEMYYKNGILGETHYIVNGQFNGLVIMFDTTGIKTSEIVFKDDMKNGTMKEFYSDDMLFSITNYRNDSLVGLGIEFFDSGDTSCLYNTFMGKVDFPITYWKKNGNKLVGEYMTGTYHKVKWTWIDSQSNIVKQEIRDTINGRFITPDFF